MQLLLRLAGKKFSHPARNEKNQLEKVRRHEPKTTKMLGEKIGELRNSCGVEVGGVVVEGMMT